MLENSLAELLLFLCQNKDWSYECLCLLKLAHFTALPVTGVTLPQKVAVTGFSTD